MDMLEFAIKMEQDGYEYYIEQSQKLADKAAQSMMISLAEDEKRHEQTIRNMQQGRHQLAQGEVMSGMKNIFEELKEENRPFLNEDDSLIKVLQRALEMEKKAVEMYQKLGTDSKSSEEADVWKALEAEEHKHAKILSLTIEYIDNPASVLEDAEMQFYGHEEAP